MNPNADQQDDVLDEVKAFSGIYQRTQAELTAPDSLDFTVKQMARDALRQEKQAAAKRRLRGQLLALAASLIIVVAMIVWLQSVPPESSPPPHIAGQPTPAWVPEPGPESVQRLPTTPIPVTPIIEDPAPQIAATPKGKKTPSVSAAPKTTVTDPEVAQDPPKPEPQVAKQATPAGNEATKEVAEKNQEPPPHYKAFLQPTRKALPVEVSAVLPLAQELEKWSVDKWVETIQTLRRQGQAELADKYTVAFKHYQPYAPVDQLLMGPTTKP